MKSHEVILTTALETERKDGDTDTAVTGGGAARSLEENISIHIFSASATMVGVCLTAIGLFRVMEELRKVNGVADNLLALDALAFLFCCLLSYGSLRLRDAERRQKTERLADIIFLVALSVMAIIAGLIAYEIA